MLCADIELLDNEVRADPADPIGERPPAERLQQEPRRAGEGEAASQDRRGLPGGLPAD